MTDSDWDARSLPLSVTVATRLVSTTVTGGMVKVVEAVVAKVKQVLVSYSKVSRRVSVQDRQTQISYDLPAVARPKAAPKATRSHTISSIVLLKVLSD